MAVENKKRKWYKPWTTKSAKHQMQLMQDMQSDLQDMQKSLANTGECSYLDENNIERKFFTTAREGAKDTQPADIKPPLANQETIDVTLDFLKNSLGMVVTGTTLEKSAAKLAELSKGKDEKALENDPAFQSEYAKFCAESHKAVEQYHTYKMMHFQNLAQKYPSQAEHWNAMAKVAQDNAVAARNDAKMNEEVAQYWNKERGVSQTRGRDTPESVYASLDPEISAYKEKLYDKAQKRDYAPPPPSKREKPIYEEVQNSPPRKLSDIAAARTDAPKPEEPIYSVVQKKKEPIYAELDLKPSEGLKKPEKPEEVIYATIAEPEAPPALPPKLKNVESEIPPPLPPKKPLFEVTVGDPTHEDLKQYQKTPPAHPSVESLKKVAAAQGFKPTEPLYQNVDAIRDSLIHPKTAAIVPPADVSTQLPKLTRSNSFKEKGSGLGGGKF